MTARIVPVGGPGDDATALDSAASEADAVVYFARIGDHGRFDGARGGPLRIMSYARDAGALASPFGRTPHAAMRALKEAVDAVLGAAGRIEIRCPLGTRVSGAPPRREGPPPDVTIRRFPLGVPAPVGAAGFSGRVALARWLTPTGNSVYDPATVALANPVMAEIADGALGALDGAAEDVAAVRTHHACIGTRFGADPGRIDSWHAGIHPGCAYPRRAAEDPDRWSNTVFANPRFLHFHACGREPPGEICWMVADPTVTVDGAALWREGRLETEGFAAIRAARAAHPDLDALLADPAQAVGI
jgi:hypothetical protein